MKAKSLKLKGKKGTSSKNPTKIWPLVSLINNYYWRSFFGPFFSFIFPIVILGILGTIFGFETLLGGGLVLPTMATGLISLPLALFEFKRSVLLKRIGATPINTNSFLLIIGIYYLFLMWISLFWTMLMYLAIFNHFWLTGRDVLNAQIPISATIVQAPILSMSLKNIFSGIEWGGFLYSQLISMLLAIVIGFAIVSVSKNVLALQAIGISIFLLSMFLAAQVIPIQSIFDNRAMWFLGYVISPFKCVSSQSIESFNGSAISLNFEGFVRGTSLVLNNSTSFIWNLNSGFNVFQITNINSNGIPVQNIFDFGTKLSNFIVPYIWIVVFVLISKKWFQWGIR